jgi:Zn-dependent membrane protease YugP
MSKLYFMIGLIVATVALIPLATIWSMNTLFPVLAIPYTFDTWCAAVVLGGVVGGSTGLSFKSK